MTAAVEVLLLQLDAGLEPPSYAHPDDAGADLRSTETFELRENAWSGPASPSRCQQAMQLLCTRAPGWPPGTGSASNAPGTVDAGYRGEIKVCLLNTDRSQPVSITRGDRIAQLVIQPVSMAAFVPVTNCRARGAAVVGMGQPAEY